MPVITVEKPLKQVLGDEGSDSLVRLLNQIQKEQKEDVLEFVEEKFERRLTEEISGLRGEMKEEIASVRVDMHKNHATLLKWMIGFWATQIAAIIGLLIAFLNK
ncbi:hypothetical protein H8E88_18805 [candidate division KSB1 bacterium]|nr:hypothetical protein [candidate division KSB1 bacterium]MBL7093334.1 hypothetical protein [candidate division KSB1 bacterium]